MLLTDKVKSFTQFMEDGMLLSAFDGIILLMVWTGEVENSLIHNNISDMPIGLRGINGTTNNARNTNQRLYCILLVIFVFNNRLIIKKIIVIKIITMLLNRKRIINSGISAFLLFCFFGEK